jgi:hypothetical protein
MQMYARVNAVERATCAVIKEKWDTICEKLVKGRGLGKDILELWRARGGPELQYCFLVPGGYMRASVSQESFKFGIDANE